MNCDNLNIRSTAEPPQLGEDGRTMTGYAVVYGVESQVLFERGSRFVEIIDREAITPELLAVSDVKALFNHGRDHLLARSVNGEGSLTLTPDERGLRFSFVLPDTTLGRDVAELVKRGDLRGCSFAFWAAREDIECSVRADGMKVCRVKKISRLVDVSVVVDPAYTQTSVEVRSLVEQHPDEYRSAPSAEDKKTLSVAAAKRKITLLFN